MAKKLYVGNLGYDVDNSDLEQLFAQHGTVHSAQVIQDRITGRSKGFGFVEMDEAEADAAMAALNGQEYSGRALTVNEAKPREGGGRGGRGGGGGYGGGGGGGGYGGGGGGGRGGRGGGGGGGGRRY